jgi:hypothetical protein
MMSYSERFSSATVDPWETDYAALVPRFTGSISAVSSALIIYIIRRSQTRLSSIYHRIMFGMSLADVCGSIAMALTSLPMPSYMPKEEIFGYHWAGTRIGNTLTCNVQGFFATFGMGCLFNYNAMLCLYYACAIAFGMREKNIKKYVEPILHGLPLLVALTFSLLPLFHQMYNPGVSAYAWCGPLPYPDECTMYDGLECIRGNGRIKKVIQILVSTIIVCDFACIIVSLLLVIYKVIQTDHVIVKLSKRYKDCGHPEMEKVLQKHHNTKVVILQASSYIAAFLLGIIPPALLSLGAIQTSDRDGNMADFFEKLMLVLLPLQGFFNFVIFVSHKIYNYRRVHCDVSICQVIALLFCTSAHDPCFISRISIVKQCNDEEGVLEDAGMDCMEETPGGGKRTGIWYELFARDENEEDLLHYRLSFMKNANTLQQEDVVENEEEDNATFDNQNSAASPPDDYGGQVFLSGTSFVDIEGASIDSSLSLILDTRD